MPIIVKQQVDRRSPFKDSAPRPYQTDTNIPVNKPGQTGPPRQFDKPRTGPYIPHSAPYQVPTPPQGTSYNPAFKLEMWNPVPPIQPMPAPKPGQPMPYNGNTVAISGVYPQYVLNNVAPNMNADMKHLFAPSSALSYGPYGPAIPLPMQNVYKINLPGPVGGHQEVKQIYEAALPYKDVKLSAMTIGERVQLYEYIRGILGRGGDGEEIDLEGGDRRQNSLLSYIKFLELNPKYDIRSNNPYNELPFGLLIYRSCFPIRLDTISNSTQCSDQSTGLNIRLYALNQAEYLTHYHRQNYLAQKYDVWRELTFYDYIKNNIIIPKQSPNFPIMYTYLYSKNGKIDYFKLKSNCLSQRDRETAYYERYQRLFKTRNPNTATYPILMGTNRSLDMQDGKMPDEVNPELQAYSGVTMIIITEAPSNNLYTWASKIYNVEGNFNQRMTNTGVYDEHIWYSVYFQIMSALYVMQKHNIYLRNMTIKDNIYIKKLKDVHGAVTYWKYIIDGVPYYVPNYGYLVMIDSNYKDIIIDTNTVATPREYKFYANNIFGITYDVSEIKLKCYENYKRIVNTNAFSREHTQNNVTRPPLQIMNFLEKLTADISEINIGKVIFNNYGQYMNNRIGTYLKKDTEVPNIRDGLPKGFKSGEMVIEVLEDQLFKWALFVKNVEGVDGMIEIYTRSTPDSKDFVTKEIRLENIKQYSAAEKVEQTYNVDKHKLSEEELLETYMI